MEHLIKSLGSEKILKHFYLGKCRQEVRLGIREEGSRDTNPQAGTKEILIIKEQLMITRAIISLLAKYIFPLKLCLYFHSTFSILYPISKSYIATLNLRKIKSFLFPSMRHIANLCCEQSGIEISVAPVLMPFADQSYSSYHHAHVGLLFSRNKIAPSH